MVSDEILKRVNKKYITDDLAYFYVEMQDIRNEESGHDEEYTNRLSENTYNSLMETTGGDKSVVSCVILNMLLNHLVRFETFVDTLTEGEKETLRIAQELLKEKKDDNKQRKNISPPNTDSGSSTN